MLKSKIKKRCQNLHGGIVFQKSDPPEACTPSIPYLGSPKTRRNHQNRKRHDIFQKSDPPEAPLAPKKPCLEVKNQEHVKNGFGKDRLDFSFPENAKNQEKLSKMAPEKIVDTSRFQKMPKVPPEKIV